MNKSFKVLWNKIRAQHVVTDEHKHAHGKGKTKSLLMTKPSISFLAMGSTLAMILAPPFAQATTITPGWSSTTVTTNGSVTDIKTNVSANGTGINKFEEFNVSARDIANLHFNASDTRLLNLVKNDVTINGVVNAVQAAAPSKLAKGELMFVTPKGLIVGSTGVINAGSFTAVATTQSQFDQYYNKSAADFANLTSTQVDDISKGEIPINPNGVITINGSVNAANKVMVAAGTVNVGSTGKVTTGVTDFTQLVNVPASESEGLTAVDSGVSGDGLTLTVDDATGDVTLISRVEGTLVGTHTSTEHQGTEAVQPDQVSHEITVNQVRAKVAVDAGAQITATGKVAIEAAAGAGAYEKGTRTTMGLGQTEVRTRFKATKDMESFDVGADVQVNGTVKGKSVQIRSVADNRLDHSLGFNLSTAKDMLGGLVPSEMTDLEGETVDSKTKSTLTMSSTARIEATDDAAVQSYADTDINISEGSTWKSFIQYPGQQYMPIVNVVKLRADSQASTTTAGQIVAGKTVTVHSGNRLRADVSAQSATGNTSQPQGAAVIAKLSGGANTTHGANIQGTDPATTTLSNVSITSRQDSDVVTKADVGVPKQGRFGLAINITEFDTKAKTTLNTPVDLKATQLTVGSDNITDTLKTLATVDVGDTTLFMKVKSKLLTPVSKLVNVANLNGGKQAADQSTSRFQAGGALNITRNAQDATVEVNRDITNRGGTVAVNAKSELSDHHYRATAKQEVQQGNEHGEASTAKYSGTLAILVNTSTAEDRQAVSSNIYVSDGADITSSTGAVTLTNTAAIEKERYKELLEDITDIYNELKDIQESDSRFTSGTAKVKEGARRIKASFESNPLWRNANSEKANDPTNPDNQERIDSFKLLNDGINELIAAGAELGWRALPKVLPFGFAVVDLVNPAAHGNLYVSAGGKTSKAAQEVTMFAGGVGIANQDIASRLVIGKHSQISGSAVTLNTTSRNENIAIGGLTDTFLGIPLPQMTKGNAVGGNFIMQSLGTNNLLLVNEDAQLHSAGVVNLKAQDTIDAYGVSFGLGFNKGTAMIAGLGTVTRSDGHNQLFIDDESRIHGSQVIANAFRDDNFVTVAGEIGRNKSSGSGAAIGAGVGVVVGGVSNELTVGDFDSYTEHGEATGSFSASDYEAGYIESTDTAGASVDLTAYHELDMNTVGLAAMLSSDDQTGGAGDTGGATGGDQSGSTGTTNSEKFAGTDTDTVDKNEGGIEKVIDMVEEFVPDGGAGTTVKAAMKSDLMTKLRNILGKIRGIEDKADNVLGQNQDANFGEGGKKLLSSTKMAQPSIAGSGGSGGSGGNSSGFRITGAGSFAWNDFDSTNATSLSSAALKDTQGVFTIRTQPSTSAGNPNRVQIVAMTDHWQWALSGAGAIGKAANSSFAASIAGAVAVNKGTTNNTVTVNGLTVLNPAELNIGSLTEGSLVSEGLGLAVANGGKNTLGFTGGVSYNATVNNVTTDVAGLTYNPGNAVGDYHQHASAKDHQITGGTGIGVSKGTKNSAAIGASVAIAGMTNTIKSDLSNSTLTNVNLVDVEALTRLLQINTAVGVQIAKGSNSLALNGSFIQSEITNTVSSSVKNSTIDLTPTGGVNVTASDGDATQFLVDYLLHLTPSKTHSEKEYVTLEDDIGNDAQFSTQLSKEDGSTLESQSVKALLDTDKNLQVNVVLGITGTQGKGGAGSAAVLVNHVNNAYTTNSENVTLTKRAPVAGVAPSATWNQLANTAMNSINVVVGAAASKGNFTAAGSVIVDKQNTSTSSVASGMNSQLMSHSILAKNRSTNVDVAGNISVALNNKAGAIGAAVVVADHNNAASTEVKGSTFLGQGATVTVDSKNLTKNIVAAVNGGVSRNAAISGSVAVNRSSNDAKSAANSVVLDSTRKLSVTSLDQSTTMTLSGALAVSTDAEKSASIAGGVSYAVSDGTTQATVDRVQSLAGTPKLEVDAKGEDKLLTMTVAGSYGSASIAGAVGINTINRTVNSTLKHLWAGNSTFENALLTQQGFDTVSVKSTNLANIGNLSLMVAIGNIAGVGAGVSKNYIGGNVTTTVEANKAKMKSLEAVASADNDIDTIGVGGSVAMERALSGSVSVNKLTGATRTTVKDNTLTVLDAAVFNALSNQTMGVYSGTLTAGLGNAIGVSVATLKNDASVETVFTNTNSITQSGGTGTLAYQGRVDDSSINDAIVEKDSLKTSTTLKDKLVNETINGIYVGSSSLATYKTLAMNIAASGSTALQGTVQVITHAGSTRSDMGAANLSAAHTLKVHTADYLNNTNVQVAATASVRNAVGVLVGLNNSKRTVSTASNGANLKAPTLKVRTEAKEGLSELLFQGAGSFTGAAGSVVAGVNRTSTKVSTDLTNSRLTGSEVLTVDSDYLHRLNTLGIAASLSGQVAAAGTAMVNQTNNQVVTTLSNTHLLGSSINLNANRKLDWDLRAGAGALSLTSYAVAAMVGVNTVKGNTAIVTKDESTLGDEHTGLVELNAHNEDQIGMSQVAASASVWQIAVAAAVLVNKVEDDATVDVNSTTIRATDINLSATQARKLEAESSSDAASLHVALNANVLVNLVGEDVEPLSDVVTVTYTAKDDDGEKEETTTVDGLLDEVEKTESVGNGEKTPDLASNGVDSSDMDVGDNQLLLFNPLESNAKFKGTRVNFDQSTVTGSRKVMISAVEDPKVGGRASGSNLVTGGMSVGAVSAGASVSVVERYVAAGVQLNHSAISAPTGSLTVGDFSKDKVEAIQGACGIGCENDGSSSNESWS